MHKGHPVSDAVMFVPRDVGFLQTRNPIGTSDATKFTNKSSFLERNPWEIAMFTESQVAQVKRTCMSWPSSWTCSVGERPARHFAVSQQESNNIQWQ